MTGVIVWKEAGFGIVLFLARLLSLPRTSEAARIDGAGFFRLHRHITIPQLRSVIPFYVVIEAITMVSWVFNYVYVMTNGQGGPGNSTMVTELYIYQTAFQYNSPELAAAAAMMLFSVLVAIFAAGWASAPWSSAPVAVEGSERAYGPRLLGGTAGRPYGPGDARPDRHCPGRRPGRETRPARP